MLLSYAYLHWSSYDAFALPLFFYLWPYSLFYRRHQLGMINHPMRSMLGHKILLPL